MHAKRTMSIDVKDLEAELFRTRRKVSDWSAATVQLASSCKDQHAAFLSDQTDKFNRLKSQHVQLQVTAEQIRKRLQNEEEETKRTEDRLAYTNEEVSTSERRFEVSKDQLEKRRSECLKQVEELEAGKRGTEEQLEQLRQQVAVFADRFGLYFPPGQGKFDIVMTHIDARDHDKKFCISVKVQDGDVYTVTKCEPLIPGLDELITEVNGTNNFAGFVKAVRARFVDLVKESEEMMT